MSSRLIAIFSSVPLVLLIVLVLIINIRLYTTPDTGSTLAELRGLKAALYEKADMKMQGLFPEGYVFMNALYGLAWCNYLHDSNDSLLLSEGLPEVAGALSRIDSPEGRQTFDEDLAIPRGAFYAGWRNYLAGHRLLIQKPGQRNPDEVRDFESNCDTIAAAIRSDVYPASYYNGSWPADVVVCAAVLQLHDRLLTPRYDTLLADWVRRIQQHAGPGNMLPFEVNAITNEVTEIPRGSSGSLMLVFLRDIDPAFATTQHHLWRKSFVDTIFGLVGVREYPKGVTGYGDVDSGPLFFDLGSAATIVGMPASSINNDAAIATAISCQVEAFGFAAGVQEKSYLFGMLPVADAFIAWSHSLMRHPVDQPIFTAFHVWSLVPLVLLASLLWLIWRRPRKKSALFVPWEP